MIINERFQYSLARFFSAAKKVKSESLGLVNDFLRGLIKVTVLLAEANNNQLCLREEG